MEASGSDNGSAVASGSGSSAVETNDSDSPAAAASDGGSSAASSSGSDNGSAVAAQALSALASISSGPGTAKPDPILSVREFSKSFGAFMAVDVDYLDVQRHAITALIGPNGAGKTTLFNLISGFESHDQGSCSFDGKAIASLPDWKIARSGLVRTFQHTRVFTKLTVLENMLLAASGQYGERLSRSFGWKWRGQDASNTGKAMDLLDQFSLNHMAGEYAGTLSGGQRKLLEMARALMADPELVLLDEPLAGVNPVLGESILEHIRNLRDDGTTVLFVEHDMLAVGAVSDWVVCMAEGRVIAEGSYSEVTSNPVVLEAYLGGSVSDE